MADGWASWDAPRQPRPVLSPVGAQQARYCPKCQTSTLFEPTGDQASLGCQRCRYRAGDPITDTELVRMIDHFGMPVPLSEIRVMV